MGRRSIMTEGSMLIWVLLAVLAPGCAVHRVARAPHANSGASEKIKIRASYYQQFDADYALDVPAEGYGGWKDAEIEIAPRHAALVVMHAWQCGTQNQFPGWYRAVEYIPRSQQIARDVFPPVLAAARAAEIKVIHVVGGGGYYEELPEYQRSLKRAGAAPELEQIEADETLGKLRAFRAEHVFPGSHNQADVKAGFAANDFPESARPLPGEPIAETSEQLFAICKEAGINHLIYIGFAIDACLLSSPGGMVDMSRHGLMCSTIRQATLAVEHKETARGETAKELALWRIAVMYGFVFDDKDFIAALGKSPD